MDWTKVSWHIEKFEDLDNQKLYEILKLRTDIFVVEQNCPYPEIDGRDQEAIHFYASYNKVVIAYCRIFLPGSLYSKEASIGRIAVVKDYRGNNLGHIIVDKSLQIIEKKVGKTDVKISAQAYLKKFYEDHGFKTISEEYVWDGIPHFDLIRAIE